MRQPIKTIVPISAEGSFAAVRKHDIHTGVDLYCDVGTKVSAMEGGMVVAVLPFTGIMADSPWWLDTQAVMVESDTRVILYGEIDPCVKVGDYVFPGDPVGSVLRVIKRDKGKPLAMLHLECYTLGTREPVWWKHNDPQPENLIDPTPLVEEACLKAKISTEPV